MQEWSTGRKLLVAFGLTVVAITVIAFVAPGARGLIGIPGGIFTAYACGKAYKYFAVQQDDK